MNRLFRPRALILLALLSSAGCSSTTTHDYVKCAIVSNPASAQVWVGSKALELEPRQRDSTPCDLLFNRPGEYEIYIRKDGFLEVMRLVTIVKDGDADGFLKSMPDQMTINLDTIEGGSKSDDDDDTKKTEKKPPYYDE